MTIWLRKISARLYLHPMTKPCKYEFTLELDDHMIMKNLNETSPAPADSTMQIRFHLRTRWRCDYDKSPCDFTGTKPRWQPSLPSFEFPTRRHVGSSFATGRKKVILHTPLAKQELKTNRFNTLGDRFNTLGDRKNTLADPASVVLIPTTKTGDQKNTLRD